MYAKMQCSELTRLLEATRRMIGMHEVEPLARFIVAEAQALSGSGSCALRIWPVDSAPQEPGVFCAGGDFASEVGAFSIPIRAGAGAQGAIVFGAHARNDDPVRDELLRIFAVQAGACLESALDRERLAERVRYLSTHDDVVTKLPNRLFFREQLRNEFDAANESNPLALLFIDLDQFERINREAGYDAGDVALRELARRMSAFAAARGFAHQPAHIGGDEFAVLVTGAVDPVETATQLLAELCEPLTIGSASYRITASAGVAVHPSAAHSSEEFVHQAEQAMYRAKESGGARCCAFEQLTASIP